LRLLSFDTSSTAVQLCLLDSGAVVFEQVIEGSGENRQEAATRLVPALDQALKAAGWDKRELSCLVVGQGPGSFTGIRSAVVTARTLAQTLTLPVIGVSLLECLAAQLARPTGVVISGAVNHFFAAAYADGAEGLLEPLQPPSYLQLAELVAVLDSLPDWAADDAARQALSGSGRHFSCLPVIKNIAEIQAQIAWDRLSLRVPARLSGSELKSLSERFHWNQVFPQYLRGPSLTLKKSHGDSHQTTDVS